MTALAACTIVSKNYIPFARVLASSFLEHHPEGRFFVLLVDRNDGHLRPEDERFTLVEAEELANVPDLPSFLFKYTLLECNTAIKPFLLEHLLERYELPNLVYFDPDILITHSLEELASLVERTSIVVTPHLTDPIEDDAHPDELAVLRSGAYNLGFIALRRTPVTERFLSWWQDRLYDRCLVRVEEGLFVDQKWMDLAPGMFGDVHILTHPGYNVAYWNLHGREVTLGDGGPRSNGQPLVFFHFSGIQPENLQHVSIHQDRYTLAGIGEAAELYRRYRDLVFAAGYLESKAWPYAFGRFDNGVVIPDQARAIYHQLSVRRRRRFGDPFAAAGTGSFFHWLNEPRKAVRRPPYLSRLLGRLYESRPDLLRIFPDVEGGDFEDYCSWLADFGRHEFKLDEAFLTHIHRESRATLFTPGGLKRRLRNRLKRLYHSELGKKARHRIKRLLGHQRYKGLRRQLRPASAAAAGVSSTSLAQRLPPPQRIEAPGVNLIGYLQAETGMGEAARALAQALETAGIPTTLHTLDLNVLARQDDTSFAPSQSDFRYGVNLLVVNADQVIPVWEHLGPEVFGGRFNIGFWLWELETFPERWRGAFDPLHEIWTPSSFCVDAISALSPVVVRRVPLPVENRLSKTWNRKHFGLPEEAFVFLFMFSYLSYFERKNPLALIRAFRQAFPAGDEALLLLKSAQSDFAPEAHERIVREIAGSNIRLIDEYQSRDEIASLTALCDCYVSLHRSEGFGLTLAEAMVLGKPVIATPYSGNVEFFNLNNGYPVRYRLVGLERDAGPYPAGAVWAEPDVGHAARLMRRVFERREEARATGERAREDVSRQLSCETIGGTIERRLGEIVRQVNRHAPSYLR
ncbi:MAG: glycosyltransferase family 4 protein [bacterium]|nr:glycosyltransferase family 4 protein [bacterium]